MTGRCSQSSFACCGAPRLGARGPGPLTASGRGVEGKMGPVGEVCVWGGWGGWGGGRFDADSCMKRIALQGSGLPCQGSSSRPKPPWALCGPVRVSCMPPTTWRRVRAAPASAGPRGGRRRPCRRKHIERTLSEPIQSRRGLCGSGRRRCLGLPVRWGPAGDSGRRRGRELRGQRWRGSLGRSCRRLRIGPVSVGAPFQSFRGEAMCLIEASCDEENR